MKAERPPQARGVGPAGRAARREFIQSNLRLVVDRQDTRRRGCRSSTSWEGNLGLTRSRSSTVEGSGADVRDVVDPPGNPAWHANTGRTIRLPPTPATTAAPARPCWLEAERGVSRPSSSSRARRRRGEGTELLPWHDPCRRPSWSARTADRLETRRGSRRESPFDAAARALLPAEVEKLLSVLDERERRILSLRFGLDRGEPRTPDEVGELVHLSRERVRQIEARALSRLRHPSADTGIRWLLAS